MALASDDRRPDQAADLATELGAALGSDVVRPSTVDDVDYFSDESLHAEPVRPAAIARPATADEVADIVAVARRLRAPVTARGAGTGLSGACIPRADGVVLSFERMARVLEIDAVNHVAVVQPGVTLAELNASAAACGLFFPVRPGTDAASLGGAIATNAGGMRAVKYGVTRRHVLGVQAVTGAGAVIRTGGRYIKNSSGYDLTALIVGSEGTLALVTEATLALAPRLSFEATLLAPFADVDAVAAAIPDLVRSGIEPAVLEYIDRGTMTGLLRHARLNLGIPAAVLVDTRAYLVVVVEARTQDRVDDDAAQIAEQLAAAGASDVYGLLPGQGSALLAAREDAFWMVKAAGADELIDMVVPRGQVPEYLRRVKAIALETGSRIYGCGHAGDGNIHFSMYESDAAQRQATQLAVYRAGLELGGAISGEHGIGRSKRAFYEQLENPDKLALQRAIKAAFDPDGILNPGCIFTAG